jgi:hypothetical protein
MKNGKLGTHENILAIAKLCAAVRAGEGVNLAGPFFCG